MSCCSQAEGVQPIITEGIVVHSMSKRTPYLLWHLCENSARDLSPSGLKQVMFVLLGCLSEPCKGLSR